MRSRNTLTAARPFFVHCETCLGSTVVDAPPALARALLEARGWLRLAKRIRNPLWYCPEHTLAAPTLANDRAANRISDAPQLLRTGSQSVSDVNQGT